MPRAATARRTTRRRPPPATCGRAWRGFAAAAGAPAGSQSLFADALSARGFDRDRTNAARFYRRIRLRDRGDA